MRENEDIKIEKDGIVNVMKVPVNKKAKEKNEKDLKIFARGVGYYLLFVLAVILLISVLMSPQIAAGHLVYFISSGISIFFYSWVISFFIKKNKTLPLVIAVFIEFVFSILLNRSLLSLILIILNGLFFYFYREVSAKKS